MSGWGGDKDKVDKFTPEIKNILKQNAQHIVNIVIAPHDKDTMQATDYIIKVESGDVAARLRWWSKYTIKKEWTVRSRRDSGAPTELSKLKNGFAQWYLYGWIINGHIDCWMLIDLDVVRARGILDEQWPEKHNRDKNGNLDGTHFIIIPNEYLKEQECIISSHNIKFNNIDEFYDQTKIKTSKIKKTLFDF